MIEPKTLIKRAPSDVVCPVPPRTMVWVIARDSDSVRSGRASQFNWTDPEAPSWVGSYRSLEDQFVPTDWYLIQRFRLYKSPIQGAFAGVCAPEYMGAAEFENGRLGQAVNRLISLARENALSRHQTPFLTTEGEPFHVIAPTEEDPALIFRGILGSSSREFRVLEDTHMSSRLHPYLGDSPTVRRSVEFEQQTEAWLTLSSSNVTNSFFTRHEVHNPVFWSVKCEVADKVWAYLHAS